MKASELREKSIEELQDEVVSLMKDQFTLRMQKSTGQLEKPHRLKEVSRDIARVKTVLNEKRSAAAAS